MDAHVWQKDMQHTRIADFPPPKDVAQEISEETRENQVGGKGA